MKETLKKTLNTKSFEDYNVKPIPENLKETLRPNMLDIIRINGRWAQIIGGGGLIKFLDEENEKIFHQINWDQYKLIKKYESSIGVFKEVYPDQITNKEISRAHYSDNERDFKHNLLIRLFGEYKLK